MSIKSSSFSNPSSYNFLALFRISVGFLMLNGHGLPKLLKFFSDEPIKFADPIGIGMLPSLILATFAEFFCSIFILVGFKTRLATIPLILTMFVIIFIEEFHSSIKERETAILYLLCYGVIYFYGSGNFSFDNPKK